MHYKTAHRKDHRGMKYGRYTVVEDLPMCEKTGHRMVLCRCECGTEKRVDLPSLVAGGAKSCGCLSRSVARDRFSAKRDTGRSPKYDISKDQLEKLLNYDPETGVLTWKSRPKEMFATDYAWKTWEKLKAGTAVSSIDTKGYVSVNLMGRVVRAHVLIMILTTGSAPEHTVDHANRDKLDNRLCNLRFATRKENQRNQKRPITNTSGHKNVHLCKRTSKWVVQMRKDDGSRYTKNGFPDIESAIAHAKEKRKELHRDFSNDGY